MSYNIKLVGENKNSEIDRSGSYYLSVLYEKIIVHAYYENALRLLPEFEFYKYHVGTRFERWRSSNGLRITGEVSEAGHVYFFKTSCLHLKDYRSGWKINPKKIRGRSGSIPLYEYIKIRENISDRANAIIYMANQVGIKLNDEELDTFIETIWKSSAFNLGAVVFTLDNKQYDKCIVLLKKNLANLISLAYLCNVKEASEYKTFILNKINSENNIDEFLNDDKTKTIAVQSTSFLIKLAYDFFQNFNHLNTFENYKTGDQFIDLNNEQLESWRTYLIMSDKFIPADLLSLNKFIPTISDVIFQTLVYYFQKLQTKKIDIVIQSILENKKSDLVKR